MSKNVLQQLSCAFLAAIVTSAAGAEVGKTLPSAEQVMDRYVEVTGGRDAYDRITNRVAEVDMDLVGQGLSLSVDVALAKPSQARIVTESEAIGRIETGVSDGVVWEVSTMGGPRLKEGDERLVALRDATLDKFAYWRQVFDQVSVDGTTTVGDADCYRVVAVGADESPMTLDYAIDSGLLLRVEMRVKTQMGEIPLVAELRDYREVDGVTLPFETHIETMGQVRVAKASSMRHNVDLPTGFFDPPEEIRQLVAAAE